MDCFRIFAQYFSLSGLGGLDLFIKTTVGYSTGSQFRPGSSVDECPVFVNTYSIAPRKLFTGDFVEQAIILWETRQIRSRARALPGPGRNGSDSAAACPNDRAVQFPVRRFLRY